MATNLSADDLAPLKTLLRRKLQNVPEHLIPDLTIQDILYQSPRALKIATVPPDLQLPFLLRNRALVDRHGSRPIKDELKQSLDITRAIFFYHLHESYQFQRYHDLSRWNLALFTAVLSASSSSTAVQPSRNRLGHVHKTEHISPAACRFMISYIAAVLECHNTPTVFGKREDFVQRWKDSRWDFFKHLGAGQKKLLKREMQRLTAEWKRELDWATKAMSSTDYDARVAKFVGCVVPGRKDQGLHIKYQGATGLADQSVDMGRTKEQGNGLLDALRVPLEEEEHQGTGLIDEDTVTPVDVRFAIACMQAIKPRDILSVLLKLYPIEKKANGRDGLVMEERDGWGLAPVEHRTR
jgi:hypothetical protein